MAPKVLPCNCAFKEWNIPICKISAILTDNASNMLKAFQQELQHTDSEESESEEVVEELTQCESYEEDFELRDVDHNLTFKCFGKCLSCFAHTL